MANLITLETYKDAVGITSSTHDFVLTSLVESASQLVKTYCNNTFVDYFTSNKVETYSINYTTTSVQLTESPVNTIVSVQERDSISKAYNTLTANLDYYFDETTDSIFRSNGANGYKTFPQGPGAVIVTYKAGYANCPTDLKLAVIDLVTYYFKTESKQRQTLAGASIQNQSSTSLRNNVAFPDHIKRVLDLYKNY